MKNKNFWDFPGCLVGKALLSSAEGVGLIPGQRMRPHMPLSQRTKNVKQKQCCKRFNKDFKNGPPQ